VASLLARIDGLMAQIAGRDERIDELLAQVKALNARIAELEAKRGGPPKTRDNSSLPPSRGQKANAPPPAIKRRRKSRPGVARKLAEKPDATRCFFAEHCACGAVLSEAGQELAKEYDHIDIPPIRPIKRRVVPRHLPLLQGAGDGERPRGYARRHAVRPGHRVDDRPTPADAMSITLDPARHVAASLYLIGGVATDDRSTPSPEVRKTSGV
jgi:transposase